MCHATRSLLVERGQLHVLLRFEYLFEHFLSKQKLISPPNFTSYYSPSNVAITIFIFIGYL